jgi:hypothetical protein
MLKFAETAQVDDTIRAFDFQPIPGRDDHFIIGTVVAKGPIHHPVEGFYMFDGYTIEITGASRETDSRIGDTGYIPFEVDMLEYDGRVENLTDAFEQFGIEEEFAALEAAMGGA